MKREIPKENIPFAIINLLSQTVARQDLLIDLFLIHSGKSPKDVEEMRSDIKKDLETKFDSVRDYLWANFGQIDDDLKHDLFS